VDALAIALREAVGRPAQPASGCFERGPLMERLLGAYEAVRQPVAPA
jgi:hypothetical protein